MYPLKTIFKSLFFFSVLFISHNVQAGSIDSLLREHTLLDSNSDKKKYLLSNYRISQAYREKQQYSKSLEFGLRALTVQNEIKDYSKNYEITFNIANAYQWLNDYEKAMDYYNLALNGLNEKKEEDKIKFGKIYSGMATVYKSLGKYELSYENQLNALSIAESLKDTSDICRSLYLLGSLFYYQKQYDKALDHYGKAQVFATAVGDEKISYACLAAIGTTYENIGELDKSLKYNQASLEKARELDHKTGIAYSLSNVGSIYMTMKKYDKAREFIEKSLELKIEQKDKWGQIGTLRSLADLFIQIKKPEEALSYLEDAYAIAKEIKSKPRQLEIMEFFWKAYRDMKDYEKAFFYMESFTAMKDSVLNESTLVEMEKLQKKYEVSNKETEILKLEKEKEVLAKDQEISTLYFYIWTVVALLFGVMLIFFISRYRIQKRSSDLLKEKNEQINVQNGELQKVNALLSETNQLLEQNKQKIEEQNDALESSNEDLRNFASVASHDLKEPLRMINSYTSILKKRYESLFDDRAHEFMGYVVDGVTRMEQLLNGLLDYSRVSIRGNENYQLVKSRDIVDMVQGNLRFPIIKNSATIKVIDQENFPVIRANKVQMIQLIQNLVSNALKFKGERLPVVTIGFERKDDFYTFYIKDNGIGISKENQEKIFEMLTRLHTKEEYEGTGIGLATVKKIVERHKGKIWVTSEEGKGSTFFFTLPVVKREVPVPA